MATNISDSQKYGVVTPPLTTSRHLGSYASGAQAQFRFATMNPLAEANLGCGQFITLEENATTGKVTAKPLSADTDKIYGISFYNEIVCYLYDSTNDVFQYPAESPVTVAVEGDFFMYAENAVDMGDDVYTRHTADGANTRIGALSNAAGTGLVKVDGATFVQTIKAAGQVKVSLTDMM